MESWHPSRIKCRFCGKFCEFVGYSSDGLPEFHCKRHGTIRWIAGKKFYRVPLPLIAKYGQFRARFDRERIPAFWANTLGIYQDANGDIWYQVSYEVRFIPKTKLFRLYIDGKPVFVKEAKRKDY